MGCSVPDADTKLIICGQPGPRHAATSYCFVADVRDRFAKKCNLRRTANGICLDVIVRWTPLVGQLMGLNKVVGLAARATLGTTPAVASPRLNQIFRATSPY
jgi:hypothetical protein